MRTYYSGESFSTSANNQFRIILNFTSYKGVEELRFSCTLKDTA